MEVSLVDLQYYNSDVILNQACGRRKTQKEKRIEKERNDRQRAFIQTLKERPHISIQDMQEILKKQNLFSAYNEVREWLIYYKWYLGIEYKNPKRRDI